MRITNPCKECDKRQVGCHGSCEEYKDYIERRRAELERIHAEMDKARRLDSYEIRKARRLGSKH